VGSAIPLRTWWRLGFPARVQYFSPPSFVETLREPAGIRIQPREVQEEVQQRLQQPNHD
jgi:hypothetical protein